MAAWPPELADLKSDMDIQEDDTRTDTVLQSMLDAAVSFVEQVRAGDFDFEDSPLSELPGPPATLRLGTIRLARRWYQRRQSPDALVAMGEMGATRIPSFDPDIERLLGVGRFAPARFA